MESNPTPKPTIRDIARLVGVSPSTVSRIMNHHETSIKVTAETKEKILAAIKQLDYSPNLNAKRLWANKTYTLGLVVPSAWRTFGTHIFSDVPFQETLCGIENILSGSPYRLMLIFQNESFLKTREYLRLFKEKVVDGLIIWGAGKKDSYIEEIASYPVVVVNSFPQTGISFNRVGANQEEGSFILTEHMITRGYRRFLYLGELPDNSISSERIAGFRRAIDRNGLTVPPTHIIKCGYTREAGYQAMNEILSKGKLTFDAICAGNDEIAFGVFLAAQKHGKKIPADFALAGADGVSGLGTDIFPLTTYKIPSRRLGEIAVETVLQILSGKVREHINIILPPELVVRETV